MALETGTTISALQSSNPIGGDPLSSADDHLRLIKAVLKAQFPGVGGQGFAVPITAKETEINFLSGITYNIKSKFDTLIADIAAAQSDATDALNVVPMGSRMVFVQPNAPAGWTKLVTWGSHMLRVVAGSGGGSGGTDSPISMTAATMPAHTHTYTTEPSQTHHTHTFTTASGGAHTHSITVPKAPSGQYAAGVPGFSLVDGSASGTSGSAGAHTHTGTTAVESAAHSHTGETNSTGSGNWSPQYVDSIVCQRTA